MSQDTCLCNVFILAFRSFKDLLIQLIVKMMPYFLSQNLNMEDGRDNEDSRTAVNRLNCMELNEIADSNGTYNEEQDNAPLNPATRPWEVSRENVVIQEELGSGFFGRVAKGTACNLPSEKGTTTVAIKMLKGIMVSILLPERFLKSTWLRVLVSQLNLAWQYPRMKS